MKLLFAVVIGALFGGATYMLLQRNAMRVILGIILLMQAVSLLLFTRAEVRQDATPIITEQDSEASLPDVAITGIPGQGPTGAGVPSLQPTPPPLPTPIVQVDPLPQALVLLIMMAGFAFTIGILVLVYRLYQTVGSGDLDAMTTMDKR